MTSPGRYLPIYLNDHLAAATAGVELARRIRDAADGELAELMRELAGEIEADRETLRGFMRAAGIGEDRVKVFAGFAGEKLGRLKLNGHLISPSPLSRLTELDGLRVIVDGRRALWQALREAGHDGLDFAALERRSEQQLERIEPHRLAAARACLGAG